ncbi:unnamed protein product, partial [Symbiodinium sp. KB8]
AKAEPIEAEAVPSEPAEAPAAMQASPRLPLEQSSEHADKASPADRSSDYGGCGSQDVKQEPADKYGIGSAAAAPGAVAKDVTESSDRLEERRAEEPQWRGSMPLGGVPDGAMSRPRRSSCIMGHKRHPVYRRPEWVRGLEDTDSANATIKSSAPIGAGGSTFHGLLRHCQDALREGDAVRGDYRRVREDLLLEVLRGPQNNDACAGSSFCPSSATSHEPQLGDRLREASGANFGICAQERRRAASSTSGTCAGGGGGSSGHRTPAADGHRGAVPAPARGTSS